MNDKKIKIIRLILWLFSGLFFLIIIILNYYPFSERSMKCDQEKCSRLVQEYSLEPLSLEINTMQKYSQAEVEITFDKQDVNAEVYLAEKNGYTSRALYSEILEELRYNNKWELIFKDDILLFQRKNVTKKFSSLDDFFTDMPPLNEIAEFNYELNEKARLANYEPSLNHQTLKPFIKGGYTFFTYLENENLDFNFEFSNNQDNNLDDFQIIIKKYPHKVVSKNSFSENIKINIPNLENGLYQVEVQAPDNLTTKTISTSLNKIVFNRGLKLFPEHSLNIYTNGNNFEIEGIEKFDNIFTGQLSKIKIPQKEVVLKTDGFIVFDPDNFFWVSDYFWSIKNLSEIKKIENFNYIIAKYNFSENKEETIIKKFNFSDLDYLSKDALINLRTSSDFKAKEIKIRFYDKY